MPDRDWESYDSKNFGETQLQTGCVDIAQQLILRSPPIDLVFGGGRRSFYPNTKSDWEYPTLKGVRTDNKSLIDEYWPGRFLWSKNELNQVRPGSATPLMGLFEPSHMHYETDRSINKNDEPTLSEMTKFAIKHFLAMNSTGFFLLIEGGKIDHGHHATQARYALDEFVEFDNAIGQAKAILNENHVLDQTLMVVTADHSHVFNIGAYSSRGSNVLGFSTLEGKNVSDVDQLPINILSYGNGPNHQSVRNAAYFSRVNTNSTEYLSPAALPLQSESHGAEDVAVYAHGPWSHLFIGTMEQHTIAHKMAYAACLGVYSNRKDCSISTTISNNNNNNRSNATAIAAATTTIQSHMKIIYYSIAILWTSFNVLSLN